MARQLIFMGLGQCFEFTLLRKLPTTVCVCGAQRNDTCLTPKTQNWSVSAEVDGCCVFSESYIVSRKTGMK